MVLWVLSFFTVPLFVPKEYQLELFEGLVYHSPLVVFPWTLTIRLLSSLMLTLEERKLSRDTSDPDSTEHSLAPDTSESNSTD